MTSNGHVHLFLPFTREEKKMNGRIVYASHCVRHTKTDRFEQRD